MGGDIWISSMFTFAFLSKQSFFAGLAASGALTSGLRLVTKAVFDKTDHGLRKGVSKLILTLWYIIFGNTCYFFTYLEKKMMAHCLIFSVFGCCFLWWCSSVPLHRYIVWVSLYIPIRVCLWQNTNCEAFP